MQIMIRVPIVSEGSSIIVNKKFVHLISELVYLIGIKLILACFVLKCFTLLNKPFRSIMSIVRQIVCHVIKLTKIMLPRRFEPY